MRFLDEIPQHRLHGQIQVSREKQVKEGVTVVEEGQKLGSEYFSGFIGHMNMLF